MILKEMEFKRLYLKHHLGIISELVQVLITVDFILY